MCRLINIDNSGHASHTAMVNSTRSAYRFCVHALSAREQAESWLSSCSCFLIIVIVVLPVLSLVFFLLLVFFFLLFFYLPPPPRPPARALAVHGLLAPC